MKTAWVLQGGWEGHEPKEVAEILGGLLQEAGFSVQIFDTLDVLKQTEALQKVDLFVPVWRMGQIKDEQLTPFLDAIRAGAGCAGLHGGMGDAFRDQTEYQYMAGGQWVAHPGNDGVTYEVNMTDKNDPVTSGLDDFTVTSEQYYMHVDPGNHVLATTSFGDVTMPVTWKKSYGAGQVFYCSLGHSASIVRMPEVLTMMQRGMVWAARESR